MRISIANISQNVADAVFLAAVHAVERQVHEDFAPLWGMDSEIRAVAMTRDTKPNPELKLSDAILYVGELSDDKNAVDNTVGYHTRNNQGIPYGFVFTDVAEKIQEPW